MLRKSLYFIHNFDAKLHYLIYYFLLKINDNDKIHLNDSVQSKKCNHRLGRWNFIVEEKDYSCEIYHALEIIRQSIFSAMENNKNSVDIALVSTKSDPDVCYLFNYKKRSESCIDIEQLKKTKTAPTDYTNNTLCECSTGIPKQSLFKVVKPVLEEMFKKTDYKITAKVFKDKIIRERSGQFLIDYKQDLNVIHIEWCIDKFFDDLIMDQKANKVELQLTA